MKIKLTKSQIELLETGTMFVGPNGIKYYYMPFWFQETLPKTDRVFEILHLDDLPNGLKQALQDLRDGKGYVAVKPDKEI